MSSEPSTASSTASSASSSTASSASSSTASNAASTIAPGPAQFPRALSVLLTAAAAIFVIAGMRAFSASLGPVMLALVIVVVVHPLQGMLIRRGVPQMAATAVMGTAAFGTLAVILASLVWSVTELVTLMTSDTYLQQANDARQRFTEWLEGRGITSEDVAEELTNIDFQSVANQLLSAVSGLFSITSAIGLLVLAMIFMVADAHGFGRAVNAMDDQRPEVSGALRSFGKRTRSYFIVSTVFGLVVAIGDVIALSIIGVSGALVWGVLAFITNYIPNIGFVIGLVPPTIVAFFEGGWQDAVWVIAAYVALNTLIQGLLQPKVVGDTVGLSATLTFLSLIFWGWVLGPIGALLAVPLTLLARALLIDADPNSAWIAPLISLRPGGEDTGELDVDLDPFDLIEDSPSDEAAGSTNSEGSTGSVEPEPSDPSTANGAAEGSNVDETQAS